MKERVLNILKAWKKLEIFEEKYLLGLEITFNRKRLITFGDIKDIDELIIEKELKDTLKKVFYDFNSKSIEDIEKFCLENGLAFWKLEKLKIISRIFSLEEYKFTKEREKLRKNESYLIFKREINEIDEIESKIQTMDKILNSLKKSYKKIDEKDIDGIEIDICEYDIFDLNKAQIISNEDIDGEELGIDDEIDGEPIDKI